MDNLETLQTDLIKPPKAKGLPLLGNLLDLVGDPINFLRTQHERHGDIFHVSALHKKYTVIAGVEANRFMSSEGRDNFSSQETWGDFVDKTDCPHLLIGSDGEAHSYQRKLLKPYFSKAAFKDRLPLLIEPIESTMKAIQSEDVVIGPFLRNLICKQIGMVLQRTAVSTEQSEAFMLAQNTYLKIYMLGKWPRILLLNPKFIFADIKTKRFSKQLIASNKARDKQQDNFVTYMDKVEEGRAEHPEWFTDGDVHGHTMLPFVGGVDPAGGTMSFVLYELLKNPELKQRITREIDANYSEGFPSFEAMDAMEDVKGLIYETLRLHPAGYALSRTAAKDFVFSGYKINKGDEMLVFGVANHFKEEYFAKPDVFDIERYREPRNEHKTRHAFAPFGRGPHTCVANKLAELQLTVNTIVMLRHVDMELLVPLDKLKKEFTPVPFVSENFKVRFTARAV
ncbi:hypothetical protein A9Q99_17605 [Gammaproteobacteria bacterium 45_16_T64]|nr:hypothetical protein A9Q99_17605 [Gammaproteobacteria bacterium 45_16_T64]